jgi:hypothetical protein
MTDGLRQAIAVFVYLQGMKLSGIAEAMVEVAQEAVAQSGTDGAEKPEKE